MICQTKRTLHTPGSLWHVQSEAVAVHEQLTRICQLHMQHEQALRQLGPYLRTNVHFDKTLIFWLGLLTCTVETEIAKSHASQAPGNRILLRQYLAEVQRHLQPKSYGH